MRALHLKILRAPSTPFSRKSSLMAHAKGCVYKHWRTATFGKGFTLRPLVIGRVADPNIPASLRLCYGTRYFLMFNYFKQQEAI